LVTGMARLFTATGYDTSWEMDHGAAMDWCEVAIRTQGAGLVVVCEAYFVSRERAGSPQWSLGQLYLLEWLCRKYGAGFVTQTPADAKTFASAELLKKVGWWNKGGAGHRHDAARHLLLFAARAGWYGGGDVVDCTARAL
jgi:hypothetical protein